jgi:ligand-binding sensor domain-containing protein/signal transduction histidine kinase
MAGPDGIRLTARSHPACMRRYGWRKIGPMAQPDTSRGAALSWHSRAAPRLILLVHVAMFASGALALQTLSVTDFMLHSWDTEDGLPSSRVNAVARTPDGYVWIATLHGLVRFDGVRFVTFNTNTTPALGHNHISCLLVDRDGVLWIGTRAAVGSLATLHEGKFTKINLDLNSPSALNGLSQDGEGSIWIATDGAGLIRFKNRRPEFFRTNHGLATDRIWQVACDTAGRPWANAGGKLYEFKQERWQSPEGVPLLSESVRTLVRSRDGGLWVGILADHPQGNRGGRIFKLKNREWMEEPGPYPWNQDSPRSKPGGLLEDRTGRLWYAAYGAGVFYREPGGSWQQLTSRGPLSQVVIDCLVEDPDGLVWIGTRAAGLQRVKARAVTTLPAAPGVEPNIFLTACVGRDGSIWGGTEGHGIHRWRDGKRIAYGVQDGLANLHVAVLFEDRQTNLWAGTWGGLFQFNGVRFEPVCDPPPLRKAVLAMLEDSRGSLWVGTDGGLVRMKDGEACVFGKREGLESFFIRAVEEDRDGQIWVAVTERGLFRLRGDHFEHYAAGQWSGERMIRALHADPSGTLWIATDGAGLVRLRDGRFTQFTTADGLPDDHLHAVLGDHLGNLWVSSDNGIFGSPKQMLERYERGHGPRLSCWRLSRTDGLPNKVCSGAGQPTGTVAVNGRLWFPNGDALASFRPGYLPQTDAVLAPVVEEAFVDGMRQLPEGDGGLRFKSGTRRLDLHFTAPNTASPERLQFRIRMEGLDREWMEVGETRIVSFNHLAPGNYEFKVAAAGLDRRWFEAAIPLNIEVVPRYFERRSVQIAGSATLLAAVASIAWGVGRARSRRHVARLELQRAMEQERRRIARDIHDDLGSGLTEIIMEGDRLQAEFPQAPGGEERIRNIATRARALTRAMDEVVWAINPRNDTLESLLTYLNNFAQSYLARAGLRCRCDAPPELPELPLSAEARHNLYLASKEALNNVVKHSGASEVWIRLEIEPAGFALSIEDNGRSFDFTLAQERGNGLNNMKKRLEDVGGTCEFSAAPGTGTQIRFSLATRRQGAARRETVHQSK